MSPGGYELGTKCVQSESLFSLEIFVYDVTVNSTVTRFSENPVPALAFRLLDFPTLLLYPSPCKDWDCADQPDFPGFLRFTFEKGKSCLFRLTLDSLHNLLSQTPLYILLLDLSPRVPVLIASCLVSLSGAAQAVKEQTDSRLNAPSAPCWLGDRTNYTFRDLMGRGVGHIRLRYRLLCLGGGFIRHLAVASSPERGPRENLGNEDHNPPQPLLFTEELEGSPSALGQGRESLKGEENVSKICEPGSYEQAQHPMVTQTMRKSRYSLGENDDRYELEEQATKANVSCPPPLYYSNTTCDNRPAESREQAAPTSIPGCAANSNFPIANQGQSTTCKDTVIKLETPLQQQPHNSVFSQLPLLNALLLELSMLKNHNPTSCQNPNHLHLAGLYNDLVTSHTEGPVPSHKSSVDKQENKVNLKLIKSKQEESLVSMSCVLSSPNPAEQKVQTRQTNASEHRRKKMLYGLTNAFKLRLQQNNPRMLLISEQREQQRMKLGAVPQIKGLPKRSMLPKTGKKSWTHSDVTNDEKAIPRGPIPPNEHIETIIQSTGLDDRKQPFVPISFHIPKSENSVSDDKIKFSMSANDSGESDHEHTTNAYIVSGKSLVNFVETQNNRISSLEKRGQVNSGEFSSRDYGGYSDDFTSPDCTGRNSDTFESSPETLFKMDPYSNLGNGKHSSKSSPGSVTEVSYSSLSDSPKPLQGTNTEKQIKVTLSSSFGDFSSQGSENNEQSSDKSFSSEISNKIRKRNKQRVKVHSSLVSSLSEKPDRAFHTPENNSYDQHINKTHNDSETMTIYNKYKHISELMVSQLPGYTL
ncbi:hypothetical protein GDO86_009637 [Hymenochirus boettgeri]|uniref:Microtubule-associated protein 10 C-terminal domain-containing protein n=1 Tax=Hymenochirus boettgeri TaxID=247094 RepID=A0A8T2JM75_9PIPI|nr:hypothetical protein GDO86_009637 [Hymenochirus boettgeri]